MEHFSSLSQARPDRPTCLTVGAFDGVHRGHQQVIRQLLTMAQQNEYRSAVLTFFPHPRQVLGVPKSHFYITMPEERARLLHQLGIDLVITHPFNEEVRNIRAADFVDMLVGHLDVKEIWVGEDFALGYKREGNVPFLRAQGVEKGFSVHQVDFLTVGGAVASSSLIRAAIRAGRVEEAARYLGRPFRIPGRVVQGDQRGRKMGYPTANLEVWEELIHPARGVYAGRAFIDEKSYQAAINIGLRPTLTSDTETVIEAHLLDFDGDLYGQELCLDLVTRLRDEEKFDNLDQLLAQLEQDVARTRQMV